MSLKYLLCSVLAVVLWSACFAEKMEKMDEATESPIADMALIDADLKTSTERPPSDMMAEKIEKKDANNTQRHTVADFIIHPLIAFKARNPEEEVSGEGKQAASSTTQSPWQLFGFNAGQGIGSSVTNLAGQVTGWINDRIQLPGLVDTPVRDSTTTSTTTPRPDVVVRVQQKASTKRPLISIRNGNRPNRRNGNKNNNFDFDSDEDDDDFEEEDDFQNNSNNSNNNNGNDDDEDDEINSADEEDDDYVPVNKNRNRNKNRNGNRFQNQNRNHNRNQGNNSIRRYNNNRQDNNDEEAEESDENRSLEYDDDDAEEEIVQRPNNRYRPVRNQHRGLQASSMNTPRRRFIAENNRRRAEDVAYDSEEEVVEDDDEDASAEAKPAKNSVEENDDDEEDEEEEGEEAQNDDEKSSNEKFYYGSRPSTKRSQSQPSFIRRGPQSILSQIRKLTLGQSPADIGAAIRKSDQVRQTRRKQATLLVNRNGQTIYMAPELLNGGAPVSNAPYYVPAVRVQPGQYPQPPLTTPQKNKGRPTQYITIPWSQLGIAPPDQLVSVTEGVQSQPFILNIPQSAINTMQNTSAKKKRKRPAMNPNAVPLLADASLMDVFRPPKTDKSRHGQKTQQKKKNASTMHKQGKPVMIATKPKPVAMNGNSAATNLPHRIRPATIVEKAPMVQSTEENNSATEETGDIMQPASNLRRTDEEFILVGEDNEPGLQRKIQPVYGDARHKAAHIHAWERPAHVRYAYRKGRTAVEQPEHASIVNEHVAAGEHQIPVQIVHEEEPVQQKPKDEVVTVAAMAEPAAADKTAVEVPKDTTKTEMETIVAATA